MKKLFLAAGLCAVLAGCATQTTLPTAEIERAARTEDAETAGCARSPSCSPIRPRARAPSSHSASMRKCSPTTRTAFMPPVIKSEIRPAMPLWVGAAPRISRRTSRPARKASGWR